MRCDKELIARSAQFYRGLETVVSLPEVLHTDSVNHNSANCMNGQQTVGHTHHLHISLIGIPEGTDGTLVAVMNLRACCEVTPRQRRAIPGRAAR